MVHPWLLNSSLLWKSQVSGNHPCQGDPALKSWIRASIGEDTWLHEVGARSADPALTRVVPHTSSHICVSEDQIHKSVWLFWLIPFKYELSDCQMCPCAGSLRTWCPNLFTRQNHWNTECSQYRIRAWKSYWETEIMTLFLLSQFNFKIKISKEKFEGTYKQG